MKKLFLLLSIVAFVSCGKETTTKKIPARQQFKEALSSLVVGQSSNTKYAGQDHHYDFISAEDLFLSMKSMKRLFQSSLKLMVQKFILTM